MARGTVLLVNSFDGREMYAEFLRAHDLMVYEAARPEDAVLFDTIHPDIVVTDMVLPIPKQ